MLFCCFDSFLSPHFISGTMAFASTSGSASGIASELQRSRCTTDRLDEEVSLWLAPQTRVQKKQWRHNEHIEIKRMRVEDDRCKLVEFAAKAKPEPKFRIGQSVHHFWAAWFPKCPPGSNPNIKKRSRPAWFSGEISSCLGWQKDVPYGGALYTGFMYLVY